MSPTVFREKGYRFFFFSREEERMHIHVYSPKGEVKFWMEPDIEVAKNYRFAPKELSQIEEIIRKREDEIRDTWKAYFGD